MKKMFAWILTVMLLAAFTTAMAEQDDALFAQLEGTEWTFSSGAGGWSTDMRILPDGSFSGEFHDSEMGEFADEYPNGTVYGCSFTGQMSVIGQVDENTWKLRVDALKVDESQPEEAIDEGIRFVFAEPYGITEGDELALYQPGTPLEGFTEEMLLWAHLLGDERPAELEDWFLYSEQYDSGFVGYAAETGVSIANPWEDMTEEGLRAVSGLSFGLPEDAENVIYRWMDSEKLAEMQFTWSGDEYCARAQAVELEEGELMEISGMYFAWDNEEEITVDGCPGTIGQAQTGSEDWVERCLWYDAEAEVMYSLSVVGNDLDGLDLTVIAGQVYRPDGE
ncbi:MAG: hypothetical protein IJH09_12385 [Clostridia bacterium]|nr:hypothetical protein [Clostridia bacterium]